MLLFIAAAVVSSSGRAFALAVAPVGSWVRWLAPPGRGERSPNQAEAAKASAPVARAPGKERSAATRAAAARRDSPERSGTGNARLAQRPVGVDRLPRLTPAVLQY